MAELQLTATALYAGINALIMLFLAGRIPVQRRKSKVGLGVGKDPALERMVRAHANNCENVPYALILIGILEIGGQPYWLVHALGIALTLGRALHAFGVSGNSGISQGRVIGIMLTWATIGVGALAAISMAILG